MQSIDKDVAKEKWCPMTHTRIMVMYDPSGAQAAQQIKQGEAESRKSTCLAGGCAAWIWDGPDQPFGRCGLVAQ